MSAAWHGDEREAEAFVQAVRHNCACERPETAPDCAPTWQRPRPLCGACGLLVADQGVVDRLVAIRRDRRRLVAGEWRQDHGSMPG